MENELRECPLCGNKELIIKDYGPQDNEVYKYFSRRYAILCVYTGSGVGCGLESGHYKAVDEAIDIWNTRHHPADETVQQAIKGYKTRLGNALNKAKRSVPVEGMIHGSTTHYETVVYVGDISQIMQTLE